MKPLYQLGIVEQLFAPSTFLRIVSTKNNDALKKPQAMVSFCSSDGFLRFYGSGRGQGL